MHPDAIAERPARPWLFAVARNLAVDAYRARKARPHEVGEAALELVPSSDEAERALESWAVADAVKALRPDHRRVLLETYYHGKSVSEAAAALGIPAGTVKSRTFYVLRAIDPAERALVDAHLSVCHDCREELAGLAGLPALLGRVPLPDVERLALDETELRDLEEPPAELLDSLLGQISARRRARRWRGVLVAAAAAIIAIGGGIGGGVLISHGQGGAFELVRGSSAVTHV